MAHTDPAPEDIKKLRELSRNGANLWMRGDTEKGKAIFYKGLEEAQKTSKVYTQFFQSLLQHYVHQNYNKSLKIIQEAVSDDCEDAFLVRNLGAVLANSKQQDKALATYKRALELDPKDPKSLFTLGMFYANTCEYKQALTMLNNSLALDPNSYEAMTWKGIVCYNLDEEEEAIMLIHSALKIDPTYPVAKRFSLFIESKKSEEGELPKPPSSTVCDLASQTQGIVAQVRESMASDFEGFLETMKKAQNHLDIFINEEKQGRSDGAWFHILRKWNSYTPILPTDGPDKSLGGGYFLQSFGTGIVIDPGISFIENFQKAGFRVADIDAIIITHAHNDHNSDLESLLTLLYKHNSKAEDPKKIDLYLNTGSFMKFSGLLNLRNTDYIKHVFTLMEGHEYQLNEKTKLKALKAYHDEVISKDYSVGLWFTVTDQEERNIIVSSDTSLYPPGKGKDEVIIDPDKEIWKSYGLEDRKIHLFIPHLGSLKEQEFTKEYKDANQMFYKNHLGILGTAVLISRIRPELAVISEFGEELCKIQEKLVDLIDQVIKKTTSGDVQLLPGDTGFIYDVLAGKVCCQISGEMKPLEDITYSMSDDWQFQYYDGSNVNPAKFSSAVTAWKKTRCQGGLVCHTKA